MHIFCAMLILSINKFSNGAFILLRAVLYLEVCKILKILVLSMFMQSLTCTGRYVDN